VLAAAAAAAARAEAAAVANRLRSPAGCCSGATSARGTAADVTATETQFVGGGGICSAERESAMGGVSGGGGADWLPEEEEVLGRRELDEDSSVSTQSTMPLILRASAVFKNT
jgi:hypothetical protein